jgi:hypothetical protein
MTGLCWKEYNQASEMVSEKQHRPFSVKITVSVFTSLQSKRLNLDIIILSPTASPGTLRSITKRFWPWSASVAKEKQQATSEKKRRFFHEPFVRIVPEKSSAFLLYRDNP